MYEGSIIWFVTEGETDQEFYKKLINYIRELHHNKPFKVQKIDFFCARGIGNFSKKILRAFYGQIVRNYPNYKKIVFLCYDTDVFEYTAKPPIDRKKIIEALKEMGADQVHQIKAKRTIEDFFMIDQEGIQKFLRLSNKYKISSGLTGLKKIVKMHKDAQKTYFKGEKSEGLIDILDMELIMSKVGDKFLTLCKELGYDCNVIKKIIRP